MGKIAKHLNQLIVGSVFDTPEVLEKYATDYSVLEVKPKLVAVPESTDDVCKLLRFFNQLAEREIKVAVTARGSGRNNGGAALSNGIVISLEKMNKMLEIDPRERLVHIQAGMTLRELNTALSVSGLTIPIFGHDDETIGGLIASNPADPMSGKYGGIENYVERVEIVLANGECLQTDKLKKYAAAKKAAEKTREGEIYQKIAKLAYEDKGLIEEIKNAPKDLAGYPGIAKVGRREMMDLAPLMFGSEGTLGIISEVILKAMPMKTRPLRAVVTFRELETAVRYMEEIKALRPERIDVYDLRVVREAYESGKNLDGIIRRLEEGYVVFANFAEWSSRAIKKIAGLKEKYPRGTKFVLENEKNRRMLNEFEKSLLNCVSYGKDSDRAPILTDFYLPAYNLVNFTKDLEVLEEKMGLELALYGSFAAENYHLRPKLKLDDENFNKKATAFLRAGAFIIDRQGGKLAGGTPEGRLKAVVVNEQMNEPQRELYARIKEIFDPNGILNPDVKLGATSRFTLTHFRK